MTTQRKSTGASALIDIMKEVYETKLRMKEVINQKIETNSDDFEEYATLAHNAIVSEYNNGIAKGYAAGWHSFFPTDVVTEDMYEEYYHSYNTYTPSIPTYTTETDVDNLLVMMQDNKRCRLLLKAALGTNSDEFVTYPDLLEALYESSFNDGYSAGVYDGVEDAKKIAVYITSNLDTITMTSQSAAQIYYYINDDYTTVYEYDGPFLLQESCTIHAYQTPYRVTTYEFTATDWSTRAFTILALEDGVIKLHYFDREQKWETYNVHQGEYITLNLSYNAYTSGVDDFIYDTTTKHAIMGNMISQATDIASYVKFKNDVGLVSAKKLYLGGQTSTWCHGVDGMFEGCTNLLYGPQLGSNITQIGGIHGCDRMFKNCTSLIEGTSFDNTSFIHTDNYNYFTCKSMFEGCTALVTAPELPYVDTIDIHSIYDNQFYCKTFYGCTSLVNGPSTIHVITIGDVMFGACESMFEGCISLVNPPELSATTIGNNGYKNMFKGCTALVTAPELPATTIGEGCYESMFEGCTSLVNPPELSATTIGSSCYKNMFKGCTALVTAPTTISVTYGIRACESMFEGCTSLVNPPELPAIILGDYCYQSMFEGCTALVTAPELPATSFEWTEGGITHSGMAVYKSMFKGCTSLVNAPDLIVAKLTGYCYESMFEGCTSLVNAPELLATTLGSYCYQSMFKGCTSLINPPELSATYVKGYCYASMFEDCTALVTAPELPAIAKGYNYPGSYCYYKMFKGCTSLVNAPELPMTTLPWGGSGMNETSNCYESMFEGCTALVTAPELPATILRHNCYTRMFYGCSRLNYIKCLTSGGYTGEYYMDDWVYGVSNSGTFVKNANATWSTGKDGIPIGWTVQEVA